MTPDGKAKLHHTADCMKYGMNGCMTDGDRCAYILDGTYSSADHTINFTTCSGSDTVSGSSTYDTKSTSGNITCSGNGETHVKLNWEQIAKI